MQANAGLKTDLPRKAQSWYEEFGLELRFPRPPVHELNELLKRIQEPEIFLRDRGKNVEIVVRLHGSSGACLPNMKKQLAKSGLTLSKTFEDILPKKLGRGRNTARVELARLAIDSYCQTWLHFFESIYVGHFHPQADSCMKTIKDEIDRASKVKYRGRQSTTKAELAGLRRRYYELLPKCRLIHGAAEQVVTPLQKSADNFTPSKLRRAIWKRVHRSVHGMPGDGYIFDGAAFRKLPYGKNAAKLHDPKTWKPHQLAISLLSFERMEAYQTIEKKIVPTWHRSKVCHPS